MRNSAKYRAILVCVAGASLALGGCGGSDAKTKAAEDAPRGIYTSTSDCADSGKIDFKTCSKAIELAVEQHNKDAPTYPSQRACEATEGVGKCERTLGNKFRPRLLAFFVVGDKDNPTGDPLYFTKTLKDEPGFQTAAKKVFLESDLTLQFSRQSVAMYEMHGREVKKRR